MQEYDVIVIGGGQAGLAISYYLTQQNLSYVVLERNRIGEAWRSQRWDSFTLVTPNWMNQLPGFPALGNLERFLLRDEVVAYLEEYTARFHLPVQTGVTVKSVKPTPNQCGYWVETESSILEAANVVVATGPFHHPKRPAFATEIPSGIVQLHSSEYCNPQSLPPGNVLVVGTGQSGAQIAEELLESGRQVYLSVSRAGRFPRRYRGKDGTEWAHRMGWLDRTVDQLKSPSDRFAANPHLSGKAGGHEINLRHLAKAGMRLLGRLVGVQGNTLRFAPDLHENLVKADQFAANFKKAVDQHVQQTGLNVPEGSPDEDTQDQSGWEIAQSPALDLHTSHITTILWATGFIRNYRWIHLPISDRNEYPIHDRGITEFPGLYFLGLEWQSKKKSALLFGVGEDAAYIAADIAANRTVTT